MYSVVGICEAAAALVAKNTNSSYFSFASKLCSEKMQSLFFCKKKSLVTLQRGVAPWKWKFRKYKIVFFCRAAAIAALKDTRLMENQILLETT